MYTNPQLRLGLRKSLKKKSVEAQDEGAVNATGGDDTSSTESAAPPQQAMSAQPSKKVPFATKPSSSESSESSVSNGEDASMSKMCKSLLNSADKVLEGYEKSLSEQ